MPDYKDVTGVTLATQSGLHHRADSGENCVRSVQTFPAGTLYTTTALSTAHYRQPWSTTAPGSLSPVTRMAFSVGRLARA